MAGEGLSLSAIWYFWPLNRKHWKTLEKKLRAYYLWYWNYLKTSCFDFSKSRWITIICSSHSLRSPGLGHIYSAIFHALLRINQRFPHLFVFYLTVKMYYFRLIWKQTGLAYRICFRVEIFSLISFKFTALTQAIRLSKEVWGTFLKLIKT